MPLYRYQCECGHNFESLEHEYTYVATCPECGEQAIFEYGASVPIFKGTGFYETDYKEKT
jgi:putative FmdB family regulatory protein